MWLASGATFAGYTIERLLGFGAMGEVYLAQRAGLTRHDALKILPAAMTADVEFRERFTREAQTATSLHHPHIVDAHERGESDGRLWTAMDYVDGSSATEAVTERHPGGMRSVLRSGSWRRSRTRWITRTGAGSCTAPSNPATCCSPTTTNRESCWSTLVSRPSGRHRPPCTTPRPNRSPAASWTSAPTSTAWRPPPSIC
ncbi:Serine/threonine-protein kinase PknI [Mycobacterium talmoniae]|uniref:non-specific serine/threonine protein kinase n=1 Tax=Mycobacterium talmoniae TaxID=1858794 RepID=A0A2S8BK81_9MYCO|nr:Serine/threonine-protein kinase PknI [Mycobacterium talmoniae]